MKIGDKLYCVEAFSFENGPNFSSWNKDKVYKLIYIDIDGYLIESEFHNCWFENEDWYNDCYKDFFITEKELRKIKLDKLKLVRK